MRILLRDSQSLRVFEVIDWLEPTAPEPGRWLDHGGRCFLILQRSHRYRLRDGRYELAAVALDVKAQRRPVDARPWKGGWVIGDPACRFNARSPLLRCAVLPDGPCERCSAFEARPAAGGGAFEAGRGPA